MQMATSAKSELTINETAAFRFNDASVTTLDGVRFDWPDSSWVNIRASNTEPVLRIFGEAKTEKRIDNIFEQVMLTLAEK